MSSKPIRPENLRGFIKDAAFYIDFFKPYRRELIWPLIFFFIKRLPSLLTPITLMYIIDFLIPAKNIPGVAVAAGIILLSYGFHVLFHRAQMLHLEGKIILDVSRLIRAKIINKLQILSLGFHIKYHSGRIFSKIMVDVDKLQRFGMEFSVLCMSVFISVVFASVTLILINPLLFSLYLLLIPAFILIHRLFHKSVKKRQRIVRLANERFNAQVGSFLTVAELARLHGEEEYEINRLKERGKHELQELIGLNFVLGLFASSITVIGQMTTICIAAVGAVAVIKKWISLGELIVFLQYIGMIIENILAVMNFYPALSEFSESVTSIREILDSEETEENEGKPAVRELTGHIYFDHVSFSYESHRSLFSDISVHIPAGAAVGIVGASGSGKSTFVNLILGLYKPQSGEIRIDDYKTTEIDMRSMRRLVGVVPQEPVILSGTVLENISPVPGRFRFEEIEAAAKIANAHDFIMDFPLGYHTVIGEGGRGLSGGQLQRISIARAVLRKPRLLFFDEATSALDSFSEAEVQKAMDNLRGRQTMVIIAHRLSTVFSADKILFFKDGRIAEQGPHKELMARSGLYASLVSEQLNIPVQLHAVTANGRE